MESEPLAYIANHNNDPSLFVGNHIIASNSWGFSADLNMARERINSAVESREKVLRERVKELEDRWERYKQADIRAKEIERTIAVEEAYRLSRIEIASLESELSKTRELHRLTIYSNCEHADEIAALKRGEHPDAIRRERAAFERAKERAAKAVFDMDECEESAYDNGGTKCGYFQAQVQAEKLIRSLQFEESK